MVAFLLPLGIGASSVATKRCGIYRQKPDLVRADAIRKGVLVVHFVCHVGVKDDAFNTVGTDVLKYPFKDVLLGHGRIGLTDC